ncbi:MAG TPA: Hsp20/alpha crystallin family protein [Candidatus Woesearchaeota archaeon]|nr:Hsp20/alpha crystallin family protein [Candidatus Woesearchaeota archaeon]
MGVKKMRSIWDEMRRIQNNMDILFSNFFSTEPLIGSEFFLEDESGKRKDLVSSNYRAPISDLYETDKEVVAELDMPGVDKKDIKVNVTKDSIEIKAEKKKEVKEEDKKKGMFRHERSFAGFYRSFALPNNVDADKANAEYKDGVLKITVPKLKIEEKKKKLLEIK